MRDILPTTRARAVIRTGGRRSRLGWDDGFTTWDAAGAKLTGAVDLEDCVFLDGTETKDDAEGDRE